MTMKLRIPCTMTVCWLPCRNDSSRVTSACVALDKTCIRTYVRTCIHTRLYIYGCDAYVYICLCTYIYTYIPIYIYINKRQDEAVCIRTAYSVLDACGLHLRLLRPSYRLLLLGLALTYATELKDQMKDAVGPIYHSNLSNPFQVPMVLQGNISLFLTLRVDPQDSPGFQCQEVHCPQS